MQAFTPEVAAVVEVDMVAPVALAEKEFPNLQAAEAEAVDTEVVEETGAWVALSLVIITEAVAVVVVAMEGKVVMVATVHFITMPQATQQLLALDTGLAEAVAPTVEAVEEDMEPIRRLNYLE